MEYSSVAVKCHYVRCGEVKVMSGVAQFRIGSAMSRPVSSCAVEVRHYVVLCGTVQVWRSTISFSQV